MLGMSRFFTQEGEAVPSDLSRPSEAAIVDTTTADSSAVPSRVAIVDEVATDLPEALASVVLEVRRQNLLATVKWFRRDSCKQR